MLERLSVDASKFDLFLFNLKIEKDEATSLLINTICKLQAVFFWPCDEKKETETSCDNRREDIAWTKKVAKCKMSDRCTNNIKG